MTPVLETSRLVLRPLEPQDSAPVQILFPHWEIVKYLSKVPWPYPPNGAETFFREVAFPAIEKGEWWHWTLRLKDRPDQVIGSVNLTTSTNDNRGFWVALPWHGQGVMTEACRIVTDYWFDTLGFDVLRVSKAVANTASRRISEKLGMHVIGIEDRDYVCGRLKSEIWEITAAEWRAYRKRG